jgi:hypothetical protein
MLVYVINSKGKPVEPVHPAEARILVKKGDAEVSGYFPFTIKLKESKVLDLKNNVLYVDLTKNTVKFNVVSGNNIIYSSELHQKADMVSNIKTNRDVRRTKRNRLRYRKDKFKKKEIANNVKVSKGWLAPSVNNKLFRISQEIDYINSIINIEPDIHVSKVKFNIKELTGDKIEWDNLRKYIYNRDKHKCVLCGAKGKIEGHHINHRHQDNYIDNVVSLCPSCHHKVTFSYPEYNKKLDAKLQGLELDDMPKESNITTALILFSQLSKKYTVVEHFGFDKSNYSQKCNNLIKKAVGVGHRRMRTFTQAHKGHNFNERNFVGNYKSGFRTGDLVMFDNKKYFVKGSSGGSWTLTDSLSTWKEVTKRVPSVLTLIHSFGSLPVQEVANYV